MVILNRTLFGWMNFFHDRVSVRTSKRIRVQLIDKLTERRDRQLSANVVRTIQMYISGTFFASES